MGIYNNTDILVSPSGDLSIGDNGDFVTTSASGVLKQDVTFRVRTNEGELELHPDFGANLEILIGEPNTRENALTGESLIADSLTFDKMVIPRDLTVKAMPISTDRVAYYVFINSSGEQINVTPEVVFSAANGMVNVDGYYPQDAGTVFLLATDGSYLLHSDGVSYIPV